eukprot:6170183-Pyramimonas_sp.AAC.1
MARLEADPVGLATPSFQLLTTTLFKAFRLGPGRAAHLAQPLAKCRGPSSNLTLWIACAAAATWLRAQRAASATCRWEPQGAETRTPM